MTSTPTTIWSVRSFGGDGRIYITDALARLTQMRLSPLLNTSGSSGSLTCADTMTLNPLTRAGKLLQLARWVKGSWKKACESEFCSDLFRISNFQRRYTDSKRSVPLDEVPVECHFQQQRTCGTSVEFLPLEHPRWLVLSISKDIRDTAKRENPV